MSKLRGGNKRNARVRQLRRFNFFLWEDCFSEIERIAHEERVSVATYVRNLILADLKQRGRLPNRKKNEK